MTDETTFGDQLEAGLTDEQLIANIRTWRHIWFLQRFMLHSTQTFLHEVLRRDAPTPVTADPNSTLIQLLSVVCAIQRTSHGRAQLYEQLEYVLKDEQLVRLVRNTRQWLDAEAVGQDPLVTVTTALHARCLSHDQAKMTSPQVEAFTAVAAELDRTTYGSPEYKQNLARLKPALDHHYGTSRHHPESFEDGVAGMSLVDAMEMFCDWMASTLRTKGGHILHSLEVQKRRFNMSSALVRTLRRTFEQVFAEEYRRDPAEFLVQLTH